MGCGSSVAVNRSSPYAQIDVAWDNVPRTCEIPIGKRYPANKLIFKRSGWKTVRIFVSSTFRDFHQEREILVKKVFPDLRLWCQKRRLHLVECDLRWGVPKDYNEAETLRVCLEEIDRCYKENTMPFFVNMTSERMGWVPLGEKVPETIRKEYKWIDYLSVTEMEIMHAAYRNDNPNALFLLRDPAFLADVPEEHKAAFVDADEMAPYKLRMLKKMIADRFPRERVVQYKCEFKGFNSLTGIVELNGLEENFAHIVYEFFRKQIESQYPLDTKPLDPYEQQRDAHQAFMKERSFDLVGRGAILKEVESFLIKPSNDVPLVLVGGPGSGKSSVMARIAESACNLAEKEKIPGGGKKGWHVFYHFVGAVPGSTDLYLALKRFLKEIDFIEESRLPKDLDTAAQLCCGALSNPSTRPVVIIIDALNQFDEEGPALVLNWIPRKLAPQVRCVFSMIHDTQQHRTLREREPPAREFALSALDVAERKEIVTTFLSKFNKSLDKDQMDVLLAKDASENPLWLSIACEELRVYGNFRKLTEKIHSIQDGLFELEKQVMDRLRAENGGELLVAAMSLLEVAKRGLLETELLKLLADEDSLFPNKDGEKRDSGKEKSSEMLHAYKWAEVYRGLHVFLRPFGDSGEGRLDFYHRSISKAVRQKYFDDIEENNNVQDQSLPFKSGEEAYRWWHSKLAAFFEAETNLERKLEEYPHHLAQINDQERLCEFLTDWKVIDMLFDPDYSGRLLDLWHKSKVPGEVSEAAYLNLIENYKNSADANQDELSERYEKISRILTQDGRFVAAAKLAKAAMQIEEKKSRPERLVELYHLLGFIGDEEMKLEEYIEISHQPRIKHILDNLNKSIELRRKFTGDVHKRKLGRALGRLSHYYAAWAVRGGNHELSRDDSLRLSRETVDECIQVFTELGDSVFRADAITSKAVSVGEANEEQLKLLKEAEESLLPLVGENHYLIDRLYANMGIHYENIGELDLAYDYFRKWYSVCTNIYGETHPKTKPANGALNEINYVGIAQKRGDAVPDAME